ncbi:dual specificity protein phosphatase family protein [Candidatus Bathyarchaeota archaeon]|nr:dual specificity protein phosphatase family protein [Candidatus Bathyarchaeota archaeon]
MRIYEIIPNKLYMSRKTSGISVENKLRSIMERDIDVVVNLCCATDEELKYEVFEYIRFPQPDKVCPDVNAYNRVAEYLIGKMEKGHVVLVHCAGGRNRSGFMCALLLMHWTGMSGIEARKVIQEKRPGSLSRKIINDELDGLEF